MSAVGVLRRMRADRLRYCGAARAVRTDLDIDIASTCHCFQRL